MLAEARTPIDAKTTGELTAELAELGAALIVRVLADLSVFPEMPQPEDGVTYAHKIDKAEGLLDFSQTAQEILRKIRAFIPIPGAFFELDGERYKLLAAEFAEANGEAGTTLDDTLTIACGNGAIRALTVQRAGKPAMPTADLLRGRPIPAGTTLA